MRTRRPAREPSSSHFRPANTAIAATTMAASCQVTHSSPTSISRCDQAVSRICPVEPKISEAAPWMT
ncbi:Uncharacterised protein [Bordetella pertussis]|nr:Uncharacterised protein [Bordetella pertussis]CFW61600.1 Uncharacterised protein [Bordetella pertussis]CPJ31228.1 Uncharacterised protein [Bordetella pertussis]CPJ85180.1 Uncharacterised protein [Bordetella pertussis]CPO85059.1 Uncharacterised protein [Bordetella pertussis]